MNKKISELEEVTVPAAADIFPISVDLATTPATKKITLANLINAINKPAGGDKEVQFNDEGSFAGNSAFVYDKTSNNLAIGLTSAEGRLHLRGTGVDASIYFDRFSADFLGPYLHFRKARAAGANASLNDYTGGAYFHGMLTADWRPLALFMAQISNVTRGEETAHIVFATNTDGSTTGFVERARIQDIGNFAVATTTPAISDGLGIHIGGKILRIGTSKTPASAGAAGNTGEFCWDANYFYMCVSANTWRRVAHDTWT